MALVTPIVGTYQKTQAVHVICRRKDRSRDHNIHPYKVIEITPPPKSLGVRCFPSNLQCGESVTIEGRTYTVSAVTHRYRLRKGKYEPSEKRLDVLSTGRGSSEDASSPVGKVEIQLGYEPNCIP
ncbi:uncharacterized protein LOC116145222 isoform X2 [Pistacia vera]|uniref:uncharacterized protein LOC116145222 isoform X2 n=1 Tax=Pistacia vera TaxID=55513 RepID=UPI001262F82B|nr:uncharacterized protein LOC116145222 isoform X2 [Pistacia vera]